MQLDDHAEELASDLGVDKQEVKADLENLIEYSVPVDEAKQSLRRKYGDTQSGETPTVSSIDEIDPDDGTVNLTARVLTVGTREIHYDGETQVIREGTIADESGKIGYTAWDDFGFEAGDTVTVGNGSVREFRDKPEINIGDSSTVTIKDESLEVPYRVGGDRSLTELSVGDSGRVIEVVVEEVETRTISGRDGETTIKSGVIADETGRLPFTDWAARPEMTTGATLRLEDVYVREFRGVPEISLSKFTTVTELNKPIEPQSDRTRLTIQEAVKTGGVYDIEIVGNIVDIQDGSGLIERCPECNRIVQNGRCRTHGDVDGVDDLRVKAVIDDGTGAATVVLDEEQTAEIYGGGIDAARQTARDAMDQSVVREKIGEEIIGREYRVSGHLSVDEYGARIEATQFVEADGNVAQQAEELLTRVES